MQVSVSSFPITVRRVIVRVACFACTALLIARIAVILNLDLNSGKALFVAAMIPVLMAFVLEAWHREAVSHQNRWTVVQNREALHRGESQVVQAEMLSKLNDLIGSEVSVVNETLDRIALLLVREESLTRVLQGRPELEIEAIKSALAELAVTSGQLLVRLRESKWSIEEIMNKQSALAEEIRRTTPSPIHAPRELKALFEMTKQMPEDVRVRFYVSELARRRGSYLSLQHVSVLAEMIRGGDPEKIGSLHGMAAEGAYQLWDHHREIVDEVHEILREESRWRQSTQALKQRQE